MKNLWRTIFVICLIVFLFCIGVFVYDYVQKENGESVISGFVKPTEAKTEELRENPIDFETLTAQYPDIYSWIKIENTNIDYPIVHPNGKSNDYYLRKNIDGEYDRQGVIYIEDYNKTDWSDPVTVIYGHNIWTMGTMFYQLHSFEDEEFFNKTKYIEIYAKGRALKYEIYSAFEYDDRHIMYSFNFNNKKVYQDFIDYTLDPLSLNKNVRKNVSVTTNDKIVVLSTCIKNREDMRYLVVGVLREDEKTK